MSRFIVTVSSLVSELQRDVLIGLGYDHIRACDWPNLGIHGHLIETRDKQLPAEILARIQKVLPNILRVYPENVFTLPDPVSKASPIGTKTVGPSLNVTLDQCMKDITMNFGPWADPGFDGGAGSGVTVLFGSLDTGVDIHHGGEDCFLDGPATDQPSNFPSRCKGSRDFAGGPPYHHHGTWTTEIMLRSPRVDGSWKGACYRASFIYAQVLDSLGSGTTSQVLDGADYLASQNVWIINCSLGGPHDEILNIAFNGLASRGILVCAASGNSGRWPPPCDGTVNSPGDADKVKSCGAGSIAMQDPNNQGQRYSQTWGSRGKRWNGTPIPFFTIGPAVTMGPGYGDPVNSGTSFSAPCHSGVAGAIMHKLTRLTPGITPLQRYNLTMQYLEQGALKLGYEKDPQYTAEQAYCIQGDGFLQAKASYDLVGGAPPQPGDKYGPASLTKQYTISQPTGNKSSALAGNFSKDVYAPGETIEFRAYLTDPGTAAGIPGRLISWDNGSIVGQVQTDANGFVVIHLSDTLPGLHDLHVVFAGDL